MLVLLAMLPFGSAAVESVFEQRVNTAQTHAQAVIELQTKIEAQLPIAGGRVAIDDNLFNTYRFGLSVYENDVLSIPEVIPAQNGALVEKVVQLQTTAKKIEATNIALQGRITLAQAKILAFEDPAIVKARKYVDSLVTLAQLNLNANVPRAYETNIALITSAQELAQTAATPVSQAEFDQENAAFTAQKNQLINGMSSLQTGYSDLMRQAIALNDAANQAKINQYNIALKVLKEQTAALQLTVENVPPPAQVDTDADGIVDANDNCPAIANANQENMDQDASGDVCDNDKDGDSIANDLDNCPNNANQNQANADGDSLGDVCDQNNQDPQLTQYEERYNELKERFNNYDDDYDEYERKYNRAEERDDASEVRKYKTKLSDLQDDVQDLADDLDDLLNDVEDDANDRDLEDDINNLIDDVQNLNENIDDTLGVKQESTTRQNQYVETPSRPQATQPNQQNVDLQPVEVQTFTGLPGAQESTTASGWESMRVYAWLGVGALLIVAVLVLLIAAIVRK